MKNCVQEKGYALDVVTPSGGMTSGNFYAVGAVYGVAALTTLEGETNVLHRRGAYTLPKVTGTAWTQFQQLYWDASVSKFSTVAAGNLPAGIALEAAADSAATGSVLLADAPTGLRMVAGEVALDGSNPTPVVTGLSTIVGVGLALKGSTAPGDNTSVVTYDTSGGTLNLYAWKNTSGSDPTLVASTGTETVGYTVFGY